LFIDWNLKLHLIIIKLINIINKNKNKNKNK
jgi:hypothetical protein